MSISKTEFSSIFYKKQIQKYTWYYQKLYQNKHCVKRLIDVDSKIKIFTLITIYFRQLLNNNNNNNCKKSHKL